MGFKVRVGGGEGVGDGGGLAAGEGTDGINKTTAGLERAANAGEQGELGGGEFADVFGGRGPPGVGVALPRADATAGGIDEDTVELSLGGKFIGAVPQGDAIVENLGASGAAFQGLESAHIAIAGPNDALIGHEIGEVEGFPALARAGVPPRFSRSRRGGVANELGGEILDFKLAGFKLFRLKKILGACKTKGFRRTFGTLAGKERFSQFEAAVRASAEPECGFALELTQIIWGQIHFAGEPSGDRTYSEGLGLHGFLIGDKAFLQSGGMLDPFLRGGLGIEPREPAEVGEDGVTDHTFGRRLQVAVALEIKPQSGIGPLVGGNGRENLSGVIERGLIGHRRQISGESEEDTDEFLIRRDCEGGVVRRAVGNAHLAARRGGVSATGAAP